MFTKVNKFGLKEMYFITQNDMQFKSKLQALLQPHPLIVHCKLASSSRAQLNISCSVKAEFCLENCNGIII